MLGRLLLHLIASGYPLGTLAGDFFYDRPDADAFDHGEYGRFPEIHFKSSILVSPKPLRRTWNPVCDLDEGYYYFFSPYGAANNHPGPMILDHQGHMIWHDEGYPRSYGLTVQEYHGQPVLTWWTGDDSVRGHGVGNYYMMDNTYRPPRKIGLQGNLPADLHEFNIQGSNALVTSFVMKGLDLEYVGKSKDGWIWDGVFQEINLDTNDVLFEWRASDHLEFADCMKLEVDGVSWESNKGTKDQPWDYFHINSVQKDQKGNYLVSARYCHIVYVDGRSGEVLWRLGGKKSSFSPVDDVPVDFDFQHHARWADDYKNITLFDNRATSVYGHDKPSRGLKYEVDTVAMTVRKVQELVHPRRWYGESQGSMQILDNGRALIGFGHSAFFTEFFPNGVVACDIQFAALHNQDDGIQRGGLGQTYRVFKHKWVGKPFYDPKVKFPDGEQAMYVSWNGATEVMEWKLEGTTDWKTWITIGIVPKVGFESQFQVNAPWWRVMRLTAISKANDTLGVWNVWQSGTTQRLREFDPYTNGEGPTFIQEPSSSMLSKLPSFLAGSATTVVLLWWWGRRNRVNSSHRRRNPLSNGGSRDLHEFKPQRVGLLSSHDTEV